MKFLSILLISLFLVSCRYDDGYRIEGKQVVYEHHWNEGNGSVITKLDADASTFMVLGDDNMSWAKDANKVYWSYIGLDFMDPSTFKVLSKAIAKDKDKVICGRDIMKEADPKSFSLRSYKDRVGNKRVYGVDKNAAYLCDYEPQGYIRIASNSIESFKPLKYGFYKDNEFVSWLGELLPNADVESFTVLTNQYAKDKNHVYYAFETLNGADPESFRVTGDLSGRDKNHRYEMEHRK